MREEVCVCVCVCECVRKRERICKSILYYKLFTVAFILQLKPGMTFSLMSARMCG